MSNKLKTPFYLSIVLAALMFIQSALGLLFWDQYRDIAWIKATWPGNDFVTLVLAVPLLILALVLVRRGSARGMLLWLGMIWYAIYNNAYYLFGAALNGFLLLYIVLLILGVATLITALASLDVPGMGASFRPNTPVRILGGYLVFVGLGLAAVWIMMWAAYIFAGQPTPVEPEAFKIVAALDLTLISAVQLWSGVQLWRRNHWGYVIAPMAAIQGALYLIVLLVNGVRFVQSGMVEAPGEIPMWGPLAFFTAVAAIVLLINVRNDPNTASTNQA